ncbi:MAG TPA: energy transducer TonB [Burkholderiales bacterium]|nr:energy transducer TonB [Burkholderiales bacterium]
MIHRRSDAPVNRLDADKRENLALRSAPSPAPPQSSGEQDGQRRPGVRVATPDEVKVRVVLYSAGAEDNPNEVMETGTGKYVYFNAPRLKQNAHPIADAKPHYPVAKLDYPHGAVTLLLQIDEEGKLEKTSVLCANPAFTESAIASIRDMRFAAAREAAGPVKSYMMVEFGYGIGAPCGPLPHNLQLGKRPG